MKKGLWDSLNACRNEEEVKAEFAKYFHIKMLTRHGIDLYTPQVLFEFKYHQNFQNAEIRARVVAQTLYYVRRLKYGVSRDPVPPSICAVNQNEGFFIQTNDFHVFYNANQKYDWDRAASQPCPVLVKALAESELIQNVHVYSFSIAGDEALFFDEVSVRTAPDKIFDYAKKTISEDNFAFVFLYWQELFGKYIKNGHKPSEYFVCDIERGRSQIIGESEVLFRLEDGTVSKSVPLLQYNHFWNTYEKISDPAVIMVIRQKMDRLSEDFMRRFTGEFYTPLPFAAKAFQYIERTVGPKKYRAGKWRIWDMAAGTGNLEFSLPASVLKYCYISTLLEDDAAYCKKIFPSATVFQYDYLNDDAFLIENPDGPLPIGVRPKLPPQLRKDLRDPEISWIIFINPPFATSNKREYTIGKKSKDEISYTLIRQLMTREGLGEVSRELFAQFLYRICVEFREKTAYLGMFSTIKYLSANNDQMLRDKIFQCKFERGFVFPSMVFQGVNGKFPVGFLVWNLKRQRHISEQEIILDVYNAECEKIGSKRIQTDTRDRFLNKWVPRMKNTGVMPPFSSAVTINRRTKDVRDRVADGFLCSLMCCGNDMQHQNYVALLSGPQASAGAFSVVPENFERAMILHTVRHLPKADWLNDRDQFYQPYSDNLPPEFVGDCVIWSAFAPSNNTVSLKDVPYQGRIYQIENQMFPFLLETVRTWNCALSDLRAQAFAANEDRFLARWIHGHSLSAEAERVLKSAETLYRCVFQNLGEISWLDYKIETWDMGWWQIRFAAKEIPRAQAFLRETGTHMAALSDKLFPQIVRYGFMPPPLEPLNDTVS